MNRAVEDGGSISEPVRWLDRADRELDFGPGRPGVREVLCRSVGPGKKRPR